MGRDAAATPAVVPLRRWPAARKKWRLEISDRVLTVITPSVKWPWVIPLEAISGVCDLSTESSLPDDLTLLRGATVVDMKAKSAHSSPNLLVILSPPQSSPPLRFGRYFGTGFGRRAVQSGSALVDAIAVESVEPSRAASFLVGRGAKRFGSRRAALISAIGAVPISTLPESERRRVRRRDRLRRFLSPLMLATVIAFIVTRITLPGSPVQLWGWMMIGASVGLFVVSCILLSYVKRQDRRPIETGRVPRSKSYGFPDD